MTRTLKRFHVSSSLASWINQKEKTNTVILPQEETHHLKNVLRIKEGDLCLVFDSEGHEFVSKIERFLKNDCSEVSFVEEVSNEEVEEVRLTIAQAIPQDRKMDDISEKASELGVYEIIPLVTERTIVRMNEEKSLKAVERWRKISEQTIKQSRLRYATKIASLTDFKSLYDTFKNYHSVYLLDTSPDAFPISKLEKANKNNHLLIIIGPEGGFSEKEILEAEQKGASRISLGKAILKTDTAFVSAASFFKLVNL